MGLLEEQQKFPNCSRQFRRKKNYRLHKKDCRPEICKDCGQCFQNLDSLNTHISLVHTQKFKCDACEKCFANKQNLKRHLLVHTGIRIQSKICHSEFNTKGSVQRHKKQQHPWHWIYTIFTCSIFKSYLNLYFSFFSSPGLVFQWQLYKSYQSHNTTFSRVSCVNRLMNF